MTTKSPKDSDNPAKDMLLLAERNLARVLRELDTVIGDLEARRQGAPDKAKSVSADVRKAIQTVFEERHRIEKLDAKSGHSAPGLDLDAARVEIGRRLARLRQRGGPDEVSEKPE